MKKWEVDNLITSHTKAGYFEKNSPFSKNVEAFLKNVEAFCFKHFGVFPKMPKCLRETSFCKFWLIRGFTATGGGWISPGESVELTE